MVEVGDKVVSTTGRSCFGADIKGRELTVGSVNTYDISITEEDGGYVLEHGTYRVVTTESKFKVGDVVHLATDKPSYCANLPRGVDLVVTNVGWCYRHKVFDVEVRRPDGCEQTVRESDLTFVAQTSTNHIVVETNSGGVNFCIRSHTHPDKASAEAEAVRLAKLNPGTSFTVFAKVSTSACEVSPVVTTQVAA